MLLMNNRRTLKSTTFIFCAIIISLAVYLGINVRDITQFTLIEKPQEINQGYFNSYQLKLKTKLENIAEHSNKIVTYSVTVKGNPSSDLEEFRDLAAEILNDLHGWVRAGVYFREVSGDADFSLVLSEAAYLPSYSSICSVDWSCRIGNNVIINDNRWKNASEPWNRSGGSLRDYRHMVINHEAGHFLGHRDNVPVCTEDGMRAPLMQQQSIDLRGCRFNPWPLDEELWTNR